MNILFIEQGKLSKTEYKKLEDAGVTIITTGAPGSITMETLKKISVSNTKSEVIAEAAIETIRDLVDNTTYTTKEVKAKFANNILRKIR